MENEPRRNNLRVVDAHLNDGRTSTSVTLAKLLVQEIEELRAELIEARLSAEEAWDAHDEKEARAAGWDEGRAYGHSDAQDYFNFGTGCGPDAWDCTCTNPYRKAAK